MTDTKIDYANNAAERIKVALDDPHLANAHVTAQIATAEAILALTEQMRLANLVAFVASVQSGITNELPDKTVMRRVESAGAQIVEGLGLA